MVQTRSSPMKAAEPAAAATATRRQASAADAAAALPEVRIVVAFTGTADASAAGQAPVAVAAPAVEAVSFSLPHPRTGAAAAFMLAAGRLMEVNVHRPSQSAWFAGDAVVADGGLYMATPVDPVFLLLPLLEAAASQGMFRDLSEILESADAPGLHAAGFAGVAAAAAPAVCDTRAAGDGTFVRLSEQKVAAWLRCKVDAAAAGLAAGASGAYASMDAAGLRQCAAAFLGDWLAPSRHAALQRDLGITVDDAGQPLATAPAVAAARPTPDSGRPQKRLRLDPKDIARARAKAVREEAKATQVKKETRGMKKMSAFFKKPVATVPAAEAAAS